MRVKRREKSKHLWKKLKGGWNSGLWRLDRGAPTISMLKEPFG
jgi:hypothetical protein